MTLINAAIILVATLITAFISGIFGMAGGLILMGVLTLILSVPVAMVVHGAIQMVSNGWRAFLLRDQIVWSVFRRYGLGSLISVALLAAIAWTPEKRIVFLLLGLTPMIVWLPKRWFHLDIQKRFQAEIAGVMVQSLNTLAGVAGPLLDLFFVETQMNRQQIVATKAATQVVAHFVKIAFWTYPIVATAGLSALPPIWLIATAIPLSMMGTWLGGRVLALMTDADFKRWMKYLVTIIGVIYLLRAAGAI